MKKKFFLLSLLIATTMMASATVVKTIGDPSKVAGTYDYTSLHAASLALYNTPLTDDCIWLICTDLDETINAGITNNTTHSLIIRPNADEERTITYTLDDDNVGPSGNIVIGGIPTSAQNTNIGWAARPTNNVTIDGFAEGGTTHRMKIVGSDGGGRTISIYGAVTNTAIKNCVIDAPRERTNNTATYAIEIRVEQLAGSSGMSDPANKTDNAPTGTLIENCKLSVLQTKSAQVIVFNGANSKTAEGKPQNTTIRNCEILSNARGVFLNGAKNANIEGCTFRFAASSAGFLAHGILGNAQTGVINVKGCKFPELVTTQAASGSYGIHGITASGGGTWNIENNIITGFDDTNAAGKNINLVGIQCGSSDCNIYHNTIVMPVLTNKPSTGQVASQAIACVWLASTKNYVVKNNILISKETTAYTSLIRGALNENCGNNVFYHDGGNAAAIAGAVIVTGEADLATADPTSKWKEAQFNADMSLADASIGDYDLAVAKLSEVPQDINGNDRLDPTYAGAEAPGALVGTLYEIGSNQEGGWAPNVGTLLTKVANNVFKYEAFISGEATFVFVTDLANAIGDEAWDYVNNRRYGATSNDLVIANGDNVDLVKGYGGNAFKVTEAGNYIVTVDFNTMKVSVVAYPKVSIAGLDGWSTDANVLEEADDHLTASKTIHLNAGWYQFKVVLNDAEWLSTGATDQIDRRYNTKSNLETGHGNYNFIADIAGDYEFVFTYADNSLDITFPDFVRAAANTNYQSLCTPFDATVVGATAYELVSADASGVNVRSVDELVAGHSYLLKPDAIGDIAINYVADGAITLTPVNPDASTTGLFGELINTWTYQYDDPEQANWRNFFVLLDDDMFHQVRAGGEVTITPTRAYLRIAGDEIVDPTSAPIRIIENATNIQNIEGQEKAVKFIQNGQIYIQKNGVVYDAMGRVIR